MAVFLKTLVGIIALTIPGLAIVTHFIAKDIRQVFPTIWHPDRLSNPFMEIAEQD